MSEEGLKVALDYVRDVETGNRRHWKSDALPPQLFRAIIQLFGQAPKTLCDALERCLLLPDESSRHLVPQLVAALGADWPDLFGGDFSDKIVLCLADSSLLSAGHTATAICRWRQGRVVTDLLLWAKKRVPKDVQAFDPSLLPSVPSMIKDLPGYEEMIRQRRDLPHSTAFAPNEARLYSASQRALKWMGIGKA